MIRANCRERFTDDDFTFIVNSLTKKSKSNQAVLSDLLTDSDCRDSILDDHSLLYSIIKNKGVSKISPFLYFYILTRKAFLHNGIDDRDITDYVASMLAQFSCTRRAHSISQQHMQSYHYLFDMLQDAIAASSFEAFLIRSHLGNYALFMTGIFPDRIYRKSTYGRKSPGFEYYEEMGKNSYRIASQHEAALKFRLEEILSRLATEFRTIRIALNKMTDNYFNLTDKSATMDKMLRQLFFGKKNRKDFDA
ncbi:MAG: hypothetical protein ACYTFW_22980 [Planctomycetota bacterium]